MVAEVDMCFVSFHIPDMYNFTNSLWKTQKKIRSMLNMWFKDNIFGIPGDEDCGEMSAFVLFSAMGFYPITPGIPVYTIGSPLFLKITIDLPNQKQFIVSASNCSEKNNYIQNAKINGELGSELYDQKNDPIEYNNLAQNDEYSEVVEEMKKLIHQHNIY